MALYLQQCNGERELCASLCGLDARYSWVVLRFTIIVLLQVDIVDTVDVE